MTIEWRPYQTEIIESVFEDWQIHNSVLAVAATGAGKTNVLFGIVERFISNHPSARVCILAHRKELIEQPLARLGQFWPHLVNRAGIVMANQNDCHRQIVIATVQTLGNKSEKRIAEVLRYGEIGLLVIDEAHHVSAQSYQQVICRFRAANPTMKILGVTATPKRSDKQTIASTFEVESANIDVVRLINEGHLCKPNLRGVKTNIDLSGVSVQGSGENRDYNKEQLVAAVETDDVFNVVIKTHMNNIGHRPTIAFLPSVAGAYRLAELLNAQGIKARAADANTPASERTEILNSFRSGEYTTLCNVGLWTEGLDLPQLECCHLLRPTKSDSLWLQMVGRVLRNHPGKTGCDIFDYEPKHSRNIKQRMELLGIQKEKPVKELKEELEEGGLSKLPKPRAGDRIEYVVLDYFSHSKEAWAATSEGWRVVTLGKGDDSIDRSLAVSPDGAQLWVIWRKEGDRWNQAKLYLQGEFDAVKAKTEEFISKYGQGAIARSNAYWRNRSPSESQIAFGQKLRVYQGGMNAGKLSDAINEKLIMQAIKRAQQMQTAPVLPVEKTTTQIVKQVEIMDSAALDRFLDNVGELEF